MNWTNVKLIFQREFRDQLRDRRTLFVIVVLPLLLYPLLGMTFLQMSQFLQQHPSRVLILTDGELPTYPPLVDEDRLAGDLDVEELIRIQVRRIDGGNLDHVRSLAMKHIDDDTQDAVVYFPASLGEMFSENSDDQAIARVLPDDSKTQPYAGEPQLFVNSARDRSRLANDRMKLALANWRTLIVDQTLERRQIPKIATTPFTVTTQDVAEPNVRRAAMWSKILPFVILLWTMTGAFYPAIDICAGEKERGTLETLLSSPAERIDIVWGKLFTVMAFSIATSLLNLLCMCFTAAFVFSSMVSHLGSETTLDLGPPPIMSLIWLVPVLIPLAALFGALSLALATMARSTKEGQYYLMPVLLITMPLVTLSVLPSTKLDLGTSLIPLTGLVLLVRQLMEGEYSDVLVHAAPVFIVTGGCCWFAIRWAVDQFNDESVLFRESERFSLGSWLVGLVRDRGPLPSAAEGILCGLIILLIRFFASLHIETPTNWSNFVAIVVVTMLAFIATPALVMAMMLTTKPLQALLIRRPAWATIPNAALLAVCLHPLAMATGAIVRHLYPIDEGTYKSMAGMAKILVDAPSTLQLLLVMAVLPAICEELAFRGFILSGLRRLGSKWRAIILSSIFFGLAHFALQQSVVAGIFGLVLGFLAVQTGSLLPCIAFHAVHNSLNILSTKFIPAIIDLVPGSGFLFRESIEFGEVHHVYNWPVLAVCGVLAMLLLRWFRSQTPRTFFVEERLHEAIDKNTPVSMAVR